MCVKNAHTTHSDIDVIVPSGSAEVNSTSSGPALNKDFSSSFRLSSYKQCDHKNMCICVVGGISSTRKSFSDSVDPAKRELQLFGSTVR